MYQLQLWLREHALIRNRIRVKSPPMSAYQSVNEQDLEKLYKCWNVDFADSCETNSSMLEAKSVNDPKIKVVPYSKYYNFALVISSMQGL